MARIGVDVGGTNTDLVLECDKGTFFHKVPSTTKDQSIAVVDGVTQICDIAGIDNLDRCAALVLAAPDVRPGNGDLFDRVVLRE